MRVRDGPGAGVTELHARLHARLSPGTCLCFRALLHGLHSLAELLIPTVYYGWGKATSAEWVGTRNRPGHCCMVCDDG